ncbi:MAG: glycosyltransferase family 1 protein [Ginsengibacter sp.]
MKIAVNASSLKKHLSINDKDPFIEIFLQMATSHPEHTFIFISDAPFPPDLHFPYNVEPIVTGHEANTPLKWRIWYNLKIPAVLKKHTAAIFISEHFCSLKTKIPQLLISPDLTFLQQPSFVNKKWIHFYKKYTPLFLKKAEAILVSSKFLKNELIAHYKTEEGKIMVTHQKPCNHFAPLGLEEKEKIKEKYTGGNEYFIYRGIISPQKNLLNLLKAFSAFKKRQRSSMHLIISGNPGQEYESLKESLRLYRFNKEVALLDDLTEIETAKIIASAYCMVYTPAYETASIAPLEAMKCEVPVIVSSSGSLPEVGGDAALYADPDHFKDIAEKMMLIFKDEGSRKVLIEKGKAHLLKYNSKETPDIFKIIENTVKDIPSVERIS